MNTVNLLGNLCYDNEMRVFSGEKANAVLHNTIAVPRNYKNKDTGKYESDFFRLEAWGAQAEFINKYFKKGSKIAITGRLRSGSYVNKDGAKIPTVDVVVGEADFAGGKSDGNNAIQQNTQQNAQDTSWMNVDPNENDLPFK